MKEEVGEGCLKAEEDVLEAEALVVSLVGFWQVKEVGAP